MWLKKSSVGDAYLNFVDATYEIKLKNYDLLFIIGISHNMSHTYKISTTSVTLSRIAATKEKSKTRKEVEASSSASESIKF